MERIPRVTITILRLAIAEMLYGPEHKPSVAINEAVELTKKYGAEEDYQFVNGLLEALPASPASSTRMPTRSTQKRSLLSCELYTGH